MIISYRHRFIFLHCRKVAGSSIAASLANHLGPEDIQLGGLVDAFDVGCLPNRRAWNSLKDPRVALNFLARYASRPLSGLNKRHIVWCLNGAQKLEFVSQLGPYPEHPHAEDVMRFDKEAWNTFFKFCFVRNPYERVLSDYFWRRSMMGLGGMTFGQFLRRMYETQCGDKTVGWRFDNWPMYTIGDKVAVDFIGRYESLERDWRDVLERLGVGASSATIPVAKRKADRYNYREWYGAEERWLVEELFCKELALFGYSF